MTDETHVPSKSDLARTMVSAEMPDFRRQLYDRYVSTFKGAGAELDEPSLHAYRHWCDTAYLPLLQGVDRDVPLLELGCGAGYLVEHLAERGFRDVRGVDISAEQVALATSRGLKVEVGDALTHLAAHSGTFGAVLAIDFVEHFTRDELLQLVPLIRTALRPGGWFIAQTPNGQGIQAASVIYGDLTHLTIFTPASLEQLLRLHGFADVECSETPLSRLGFGGAVRPVLWSIVTGAANALKRVQGASSQRVWTQNFLCRARSPAPDVL